MENKPMIIAIEEAEQMLVGAVNNALASGVTPYFLGMVFDKVHGQIKELAKQEMNNARTQYENALKATTSGEQSPEVENVSQETISQNEQNM